MILDFLEENKRQKKHFAKKNTSFMKQPQTAKIKIRKKEALKNFSKEYLTNFKDPDSNSLKKINMRTKLKHKTHSKRTGNKNIVLKTWEESVSNKSAG